MIAVLNELDSKLSRHTEWTAEALVSLDHWLNGKQAWLDEGFANLEDAELACLA